ncbi:MAG: site-2 protease family protein [Clostridiales bacterium]|jgi:Zn-dependent protease|nr:site-2 protease family protein [Clostridiales bacterium]
MPQLSQDAIEILYRVPVLLLSFMIHELSHALVALWNGDTTAKDAGRITLNPLKHIDLIGAALLIFARFGWAKPVPINPNNFRRPKQGIVMTSLAGPLSNVLLAFIFAVPYMALMLKYDIGSLEQFSAPAVAINLFWEFVLINMSLAAFNLIPIPPLDGSKVLFAILPDRIYYNYVLRFERYGMILLIALSLTGILGRLMSPMYNGLWRLIVTVLRPIILRFA